MKRVNWQALLWIFFAACALAAMVPLVLTLIYSSEYDLLYVPFASWFVLGLSGLIVILDGVACCFWLGLRRARQERTGRDQELSTPGQVPAICGHKHVDKAEFLAIIQGLFRHLPDKYLQVNPLPGGYGGGATVLVERRAGQAGASLPQSFVVKLGDRREMADEHVKFQKHVQGRLAQAARFFRYAEWEDYAGIAYEFVGMGVGNEIQSFYQFYQGHTAAEVSTLIGEVYSHLEEAWYQRGQKGPANLYHEYDLLNRKRDSLIGHIGEIVDENDPYRVNFTILEARLQPNLKPGFCAQTDIPWHDPVAFLRAWPRQTRVLPIHRSVVHGDLHAQNVLVEVGKNSQKRVWFIDFSHTGNGLSGHRAHEAQGRGILLDPERGHTLRDYCRLEADIKFILTQLQDPGDLRLAVAFERELMACGLALYDLPVAPPPTEALMEERFRKAWLAVREIRRRAAAYLANADDLRPYYQSLLHATLPIVYYRREQFESEACERQQKRYALVAAGMACSQL